MCLITYPFLYDITNPETQESKGFEYPIYLPCNTVNTTKYYTFIHFFIFTNFFSFLFSEHCEVNESTSSSTSALYINENDSSSNPQGKVRLPWLPKALQSSTISESDDVR